MITIAVDAMGGDEGLPVTVPAAIHFLRQHEDAFLLMVGHEEALLRELTARRAPTDRLRIVPAGEVVGMDEAPQHALKNKKDSSMRVAVNQVKTGEAVAAVSAGNTGALMATAKFVLKTLDGIQRPAIAKFLPTQNDDTVCALDLGANVDCPSEQIFQFAVMGSQLVKFMQPEKDRPRVALLNVGSEEIKGTDTVKSAHLLLRQSSLNFVGNMEGSDIFSGKTDVMVCDGFVGNIALKTMEGTARFITDNVKREFKRGFLSRLSGLCALPVLKRFRARMDPRRYNGAIFLGLRGIVVKSHGGTDAMGFFFALEEAYREARADFLKGLEGAVEEALSARESDKEAG